MATRGSMKSHQHVRSHIVLSQSLWPRVHNLCLEVDLFGAHACKFTVHGFHFGRYKNGLLIKVVSHCPRGLEDDVAWCQGAGVGM